MESRGTQGTVLITTIALVPIHMGTVSTWKTRRQLLGLVTVSFISGIPLTKMIVSILPFIAIELVMIYPLYFVPQLTLFLPSHMSMH